MALTIYLAGSLRNPQVPIVAEALRAEGFNVFDDWYAAGPRADDSWQAYEEQRKRTYGNALENGLAAGHIFDFDYLHLSRADIGVLVAPAGRSSHMELGYLLGAGKPGYIFIPEAPERWDVMYKLASGVAFELVQLVELVREGAALRAALSYASR